MKFRMMQAAVPAAILAVFSLVLGASAEEKRERWKFHSSAPSAMKIYGVGGKRMAENITKASGGSLEFRFYEPGALVPAIQYFDPVSTGSIEAAWGGPGFFVGKVPALALFSSVPFGADGPEYMAWKNSGGGNELQDEIYHKFGLHGRTCGLITGSGMWFREEVKSVDDLRGKKMRFFGLGAKVIERFGVSTQLLAAGDIYPALELGTIDAAEYANPILDEALNLSNVAKYYYLPGWQKHVAVLELMVNKARYDGLSEQHRRIVELACGDTLAWTVSEGEALNFGALHRMREKGVNLRQWPDSMLQQFRAAWEDLAKQEAEKDPLFAKVYASYSDFHSKYMLWKELAYGHW